MNALDAMHEQIAQDHRRTNAALDAVEGISTDGLERIGRAGLALLAAEIDASPCWTLIIVHHNMDDYLSLYHATTVEVIDAPTVAAAWAQWRAANNDLNNAHLVAAFRGSHLCCADEAINEETET